MAFETEIQRLQNLLANPRQVLGRDPSPNELTTWQRDLQRLQAGQTTGQIPPIDEFPAPDVLFRTSPGAEEFQPPEQVFGAAPAAEFPAPDVLFKPRSFQERAEEIAGGPLDPRQLTRLQQQVERIGPGRPLAEREEAILKTQRRSRTGEVITGGLISGVPIVGGKITEALQLQPRTAGEQAVAGVASVPTAIASFGTAIGLTSRLTSLSQLVKNSPKLAAITNWGIAAAGLSALNIDDRDLYQRLKDAGVAGVESSLLGAFVTPGTKKALELMKAGKLPQFSRGQMALRFGAFAGLRSTIAGGAPPITVTGNEVADSILWDAAVAAVYAHGRPRVGQRLPVMVRENRPIKPGDPIGPPYTLENATILGVEKRFHRNFYKLKLADGNVVEWAYGQPINRNGGSRLENVVDKAVSPSGETIKAGELVTWTAGKTRQTGIVRGFFRDPNKPGKPLLLVNIPDALGKTAGVVAWVDPGKDIRILEGKAKSDWLASRPPTPTEPAPPTPGDVGGLSQQALFGRPPSHIPTDSERVKTAGFPEDTPVDVLDLPPVFIEVGGHKFPIYGQSKAAQGFAAAVAKRTLGNLDSADLKRLATMKNNKGTPGVQFIAMTEPPGGYTLADAHYNERAIRIDVTERTGQVTAAGRYVPKSALDRQSITLLHEIVHQDHTTDQRQYTPEAARYGDAVGWKSIVNAPPDVVRTDPANPRSPIASELVREFGFTAGGVERWRRQDGSELLVVTDFSSWLNVRWRPLTPFESRLDKDSIDMAFRRKNLSEDIADTAELFASDPDLLRRIDPERFNIFLEILKPRILRGVTATAEGQLLLFPPQAQAARPQADPTSAAQQPAPGGRPSEQLELPLASQQAGRWRTDDPAFRAALEYASRERRERRDRSEYAYTRDADRRGQDPYVVVTHTPTGEVIGSFPNIEAATAAVSRDIRNVELGVETGVAQFLLPSSSEQAVRQPPRDRMADMLKLINETTDPAERAKQEEILENVVKPVDEMVETTARAMEVDPTALRGKALDRALQMALRDGTRPAVQKVITDAAKDLRRSKHDKTVSGGGIADSLLGEGGGPVAPGALRGGATTQRIRGRLLGAIQNLKGTPEGQLRIADALARIQDSNVRETIKLAAGVDDNGHPLGQPVPLGDAAKQRGVTLRQIQEAIKVDKDGIFKVKEAADAAKGAAKVLGVKPGKDPVGAVITRAREIDAALAKSPTNEKLQRAASEMRRRLAALQKQGESLTPEQRAALKAAGYDPAAVQKTLDAEHPSKPVVDEPPPADRGLKFPTSNDALAAEWKRLADRIPRAPEKQAAFTKAIERMKAIEAEMGRRGLKLEPSGGFPGGRPPKGGHPRRKSKSPPPDQPIDRDYVTEVVPELDPYAIDAARLAGDLTPTRVIIRRRADNVIVGNYSSRPLRPQFWAQTRFKVEPFNFRPPKVSDPPLSSALTAHLVPGATAETPKLSGAFKFRVVDRTTGEEVGFMSPDQLRRFMGGQFIDGLTIDAETGEMLPSGRDIATDIRTSAPPDIPIGARIGTHGLTEVEFMNLPGSVQVSHILKMADNAKSGEAAWAAWTKFSGMVHNYDGRVRDIEAALAHVQNRWGDPGPRYAGHHELLQMVDKVKSSYLSDKRAGVAHFLDYADMDLGGTGKAYDPGRLQESRDRFGDIVDRIVKPKEIMGDAAGTHADGRLTWLASRGLMSPTRQHYLFGHPVAADLHMKTRFADVHMNRRISYHSERLEAELVDVSFPEEVAIQMWLEGRHEAHKTLGVPTRQLRADVTRSTPLGGRDVRNAITKIREVFGGRVPLEQIVIPEMSPRLTQKALRIRQIMTEIADEAGLPRYQRIEQYWPHFFRRLGIGDQSYYDLPADMNVSSDVFFRFFQPRKHPDVTGYELGIRDTFSVYVRGAMRKSSFDPLVAEFNSPQVQSVLPNDQRREMAEFLRYVIGAPSSDDILLSKSLRWFVESAPPWGFIRGLRRAVLSSQRPAYALAEIIRGYQFFRTLGLNGGFLATNLQQAPLTYLMRHKWSGYIDVLSKSGIFRDSVISKYFEASKIAGEIKRSELGVDVGRSKGYITRAANAVAGLIQSTEIINRRQSFAAGFKVAKEAGLLDGEAVAAGIMESDLTQFNMTRTGRLGITRSPFGSVAFQFMQYNVEMSQLVGRELFGLTGLAGAERFKQAATRLTKLGLAAHLLGGVNAHIGPFLQYIHGMNQKLFGEEFDAEFDEILHMLDALSFDYILGSWLRGRPFEFGHKINPINVFFKYTSPLGPALGAAAELVQKVSGLPGAPTTGQMVVRGMPFGIAAERLFADEIERYILQPLARATGGRPQQTRLRGGRDVSEKILGRDPAITRGRFQSDPGAAKRLAKKLGLAP